jgi:hypothetical protein
MKTIIRWVFFAPVFTVSFAWACAALYFDGPFSGLIAVAFACAALGILGWVRPFSKGLAFFGALFLAVLIWWLSLEPSNEREWLPDVARLPAAEIDGDRVVVRNVRNFVYRSEFDYDERWEERTYDLSKLKGVDVFLIYWGSPWIAHTIMSWVFEDQPPLAISIETRKEVGEEYSAVRGFFRQFEIYYVVSWYNAFRYNCTTAIRHHVQNVAPGSPFDWRILLNGHIDQLAYERGNIDTSLPFDELKQKSEINERARAVVRDSDFSTKIREGLPERGRATRRTDSRRSGSRR